MELIDILSDAVIDTLKEFYAANRPVTSATLKMALSTKKEVISLLRADESTENGRSRYSSVREQCLDLQTDSGPTLGPEIEGFRDTFLKILDNLAPVISGEYEARYSILQQKIQECKSYHFLDVLAEQIVQIVGELINDAVERIQFSNDFLVELSKDLLKIEDHLTSCQTYNTETHKISSYFNDYLSSHTNDMFCAIDSGTNIRNIHNVIIGKLGMISKSIEIKKNTDEIRLREANTRIAELQNNIKTYEFEIVQVKERSESLEKEVLLDELTQINNRRAYDLKMMDCLRRYHRSGDCFGIILIDIDHFKIVNDNFGHKAGDKCLKEVVSLVRLSLRETDFLARYGGEEFVAILNGSNVWNARIVAEKIRSRIEKARFYFQDEEIPITISLGVTEITHSDIEPEAPFIRVDAAMYRAKKGGRNRVCVNTGDSPSAGTAGSQTAGISS